MTKKTLAELEQLLDDDNLLTSSDFDLTSRIKDNSKKRASIESDYRYGTREKNKKDYRSVLPQSDWETTKVLLYEELLSIIKEHKSWSIVDLQNYLTRMIDSNNDWLNVFHSYKLDFGKSPYKPMAKDSKSKKKSKKRM